MSLHLRWLVTGLALLVTGVFLASSGPPALAGDKDEMVDNPFFKFWAKFKKGATAVHLEQTKLGGPAGAQSTSPDEKRIAYKLVDLNDKRATVETVATEKDYFGYVQAAPTRHIYPAKVSKSDLKRFLLDTGTKFGNDTVKIKGKEIECKTVSGTIKAPGGETTEYKLWLSDNVPGSIVKQVRTTRQKGELIAETTTTLQSFKKVD